MATAECCFILGDMNPIKRNVLNVSLNILHLNEVILL